VVSAVALVWIVVGLVGALFAAELAARFDFAHRTGASIFAPPPLPDAAYAQAPAAKTEIRTFGDYLVPHPHVGYVLRPGATYMLAKTTGQTPLINSDGFTDAPWPAVRDPDAYTILFTGGSVAGLLPLHVEASLHERLNRYEAPDGRPLRLLNGALGGWKQPQQLMLFQLMADRIDAVVTLEGFNEMGAIGQAAGDIAYRMDFNPWTQKQLLTLELDTEKLVRRVRAAQVTRLAQTNLALKWSHLAALLARSYARGATQFTPETLDTPWRYPESVDKPARRDAALADYRRYLGLMGHGARALGLPFLALIQPAPAFGKTLTAEERAVVGELNYSRIYATMRETVASLRGEGVAIEDMADVFIGVSETVYVDKVHYNTLGNRIMAEAVVAAIVAHFGLRAKTDQAAETAA
jgi:hypothetical protein